MPIKQELLDQLHEKTSEAQLGGGEEKIAKRHARGLLTARERLLALYTPNTFQEFGLHAQHDSRHFGMEKKRLPGDGVVTGVGFVDGRPVVGISQDFTVAGGSLGRVHAQKMCDVMDHAARGGMPLVAFNDSGGARIQEGVNSLSGYGSVFYHNVQLSGLVPQIAVIAGNCAGGASYSPALMDFIIMTRENANMFICGPEVIRAVTGQQCSMEEIGSPQAHMTISGNIHFIAEDDVDAIRIVSELLSYLPSNNMMDPPHDLQAELTLALDPVLNELLPEDPKHAFDVRKVIGQLSDRQRYLEIQKDFAPNIVIAFGRIGGVVVGYIANQPMVKAGALDIDAADKAARFIRFCNCFNIPIVTLVDVPGFLPGVRQEQGGIIRHGAKMLFAYGAATVPKITIIMRKAYGGAYLAMCSRDMGADLVLAWPTAEIAVMGAESAVNILYRRELAEADDRAEQTARFAQEYREKFASPYLSAGQMFVHDVIEPGRTRSTVSLTLRSLLSKREARPPKKHGNIPL
jgi:propionyl-CoA carboxylase beta chain